MLPSRARRSALWHLQEMEMAPDHWKMGYAPVHKISIHCWLKELSKPRQALASSSQTPVQHLRYTRLVLCTSWYTTVSGAGLRAFSGSAPPGADDEAAEADLAPPLRASASARFSCSSAASTPAATADEGCTRACTPDLRTTNETLDWAVGTTAAAAGISSPAPFPLLLLLLAPAVICSDASMAPCPAPSLLA